MTYTKYPNSIDTSTELPKATDNITPVIAEVINRLREAIIAIENELGINPSSIYGSIRERLDALDGYSSDGYSSDGYSSDGYSSDGYSSVNIYSDGYFVNSTNKLNFTGSGVSLNDDLDNQKIDILINGGATIDFEAVKTALALADSSIDFANQQLTNIAAPVLPNDGARLQDILNAITTSEAYTDNAIASINGGITQLTQDVLAGDGYGSQVATVVGLYGNPLSNTAPNSDEVLAWNGSIWIPTAINSSSGWSLARSINFTTYGNSNQYDLKTNLGTHGTHIIDGMTWHFSGLENASSGTLDSNGIYFNDVGGVIQSFVLLSELFNGIDISNKELFIAYNIIFQAGQEPGHYLTTCVVLNTSVVDDSISTSNQIGAVMSASYGGFPWYAVQSDFGLGAISQNVTALDLDTWRGIYLTRGGKSWGIYSGTYGTELPGGPEDLQEGFKSTSLRLTPCVTRLNNSSTEWLLLQTNRTNLKIQHIAAYYK